MEPTRRSRKPFANRKRNFRRNRRNTEIQRGQQRRKRKSRRKRRRRNKKQTYFNEYSKASQRLSESYGLSAIRIATDLSRDKNKSQR